MRASPGSDDDLRFAPACEHGMSSSLVDCECHVLVQSQPDTVNYSGRADTVFAVVLETTSTNASGAFRVVAQSAQDWGGLHDIYAVVKGVEDAHGGFITLRTVTVTPRSGPVGTPITITYSGLGATLYTGGHPFSGTTTTWAR